MNKPSFEISENEGSLELKASGELTASHAVDFRLHLLKLLQRARPKSYKLNLGGASAIDASCIQLIWLFKREQTIVKTDVIIELPEEPGVKAFLAKTRVSKILS